MLNDDYETDNLPHTIRDDVFVLQCFKNKLDEWNVLVRLFNQIQERIDYYCNYHSCNCSIQIDCECSAYFYHYYAISDEQVTFFRCFQLSSYTLK